MEISYDKKNGISFMQFSDDLPPDYTMEIILHNKIPHLLNLSISNMDNKSIYSYNISGCMALTDYYEKKELKKDDLTAFFSLFSMLLSKIDDYLLDVNALILDPELIFIDNSTGEWRFCYYCNNDKSYESGIKALFEYLLQKICHTDNCAITMAYGAYRKIVNGVFTPDLLFSHESEPKLTYGEIRTEETAVSEVLPEVTEIEKEVPDKRKMLLVYGFCALASIVFLGGFIGFFVSGNSSFFAMPLLSGAGSIFAFRWYKENRNLFFTIKTVRQKSVFTRESVRVTCGDDTPSDSACTVLLSSEASLQERSLVWNDASGAHRFVIKERTTIIGSASDKSDCTIVSSGISRMHARVLKEGEHYFIKDLNSTNGTFVNGRQLACFEILELTPNTEIMLGNMRCTFV